MFANFNFPQLTDLQRRAIYLLLVSAIAIGALFLSLARGHAQTNPSPGLSEISMQGPKPSISISPTTIVVDVAGKVLHPNIYTLPSGSRAADAISAAGGALKGVLLTDINLAHILVDGEQIVVGAVAPVQSGVVASGRGRGTNGKFGKSSTSIVNLNTASPIQLQVLAGVGPVMAAKIIAYRKAHGRFTAIDELAKVPGFGRAKFEIIKSQLRI